MTPDTDQAVRLAAPVVALLSVTLLLAAHRWRRAWVRDQVPLTQSLALTSLLLGVAVAGVLLSTLGPLPPPAPVDPVVLSGGALSGALVPLATAGSTRRAPTGALLAISVQLSGLSIAMLAAQLLGQLPVPLDQALLWTVTGGVLVLGVHAGRTVVSSTGLLHQQRLVVTVALAGLVAAWLAQAHLLRHGVVALPLAGLALVAGMLLLASSTHTLVLSVTPVTPGAPDVSTAEPRARTAAVVEVPHPRRQRQQDVLHEARSIAAGIASAADAVSEQSGRGGLLTMLSAESRRLQRLLDTSRLGTAPTHPGPAVPTSATTDLHQLLEVLVTAHRARGLDVQWQPGRDRVALRGGPDADLAAQVVNTLLDNVHHHAAGARVRLEVLPGPSQVVLLVADDGPGLHPLVAEHLFVPGCRSPLSRGTGRGLHLARGLAGELGGDVLLRGTGRGGTTFEVRLPTLDRARAGR